MFNSSAVLDKSPLPLWTVTVLLQLAMCSVASLHIAYTVCQRVFWKASRSDFYHRLLPDLYHTVGRRSLVLCVCLAASLAHASQSSSHPPPPAPQQAQFLRSFLCLEYLPSGNPHLSFCLFRCPLVEGLSCLMEQPPSTFLLPITCFVFYNAFLC